MDKRLEGKVAVVVGGGQTPGTGIGNGRAISIMLARHGARVLVTARHLDRAQATVDMIKEEGGEASAAAADILYEEQCRDIMKTCVQRYGKIDILVNNAGIAPRADAGDRILDEEKWDMAMNVNIRGVLYCCCHAIPYMAEQGKGSIVNISSTASIAVNKSSNVGSFTYGISKRGLNALSELLAIQNAEKGIRCNTIILGSMDTPMGMDAFSKSMGSISHEEATKIRNRGIPLKGGMGDAWDTAYAVLFLASDESKFITGASLPVDGGCTVRRG